MSDAERMLMEELAGQYGLEIRYFDGTGRLQTAPSETLLYVLNVLGAGLTRPADAAESLRRFRLERASRTIEPVLTLWTNAAPVISFRHPATVPLRAVDFVLKLATGETRVYQWSPPESGPSDSVELEGWRLERWDVRLPEPLPDGYHELSFELNGRSHQALLIAAPPRAWTFPENERFWGLFCPLYAVRTEQNWGAGDFSDLDRLVEWTSGQGGRILGTLPLFAAFLDEPLDPSPYAPVSRFFWNEFFIDPVQAPEWNHCAATRRLFESTPFQQALTDQRNQDWVQYRVQMQLKRTVLQELARNFFESDRLQDGRFQQFCDQHPLLEEYASFRAAHEKMKSGWRDWPARLRDGRIEPSDYDNAHRQYHRYVQWLAASQLNGVIQRATECNVNLYLDLPLGVHADGFDVWRFRDAFAQGVSGGSPPDTFFTAGQNWGFPPLHPLRAREQSWSYLRRYLSGLTHQAHLLRIDHIMSLHRLYWVPEGSKATEGVYVHYPADELYAIFCLESRRHGTAIVGEDLGTVPPAVRETMAHRGFYRMYVGQFELGPDAQAALNPALAAAITGLNTHDTVPFAAFWTGQDVDLRREMGLIDAQEALQQKSGREQQKRLVVEFLRQSGLLTGPDDVQAVLRAWLGFLSSSPARMLLVSLEDLWLEERPQNVPGTGWERPNWQRKVQFSFEKFCTLPEVVDTLQEIDRRRRVEPES